MPRKALAAILPQLGARLHLAAGEGLELVADDAQLVHLEHHRADAAPLALTPPMAPDRLLDLVAGMGLALDLDRHCAPSQRPQEPR